MPGEFATKVYKGLSLLSVNQINAIDADRINIADTDDCILGQLSLDNWFNLALDLGMNDEVLEEYGFDVYATVIQDKEYYKLNRIWAYAIRKLQEKTYNG